MRQILGKWWMCPSCGSKVQPTAWFPEHIKQLKKDGTRRCQCTPPFPGCEGVLVELTESEVKQVLGQAKREAR